MLAGSSLLPSSLLLGFSIDGTYLNIFYLYNSGYGIIQKERRVLIPLLYLVFVIHYRFLKKSIEPNISTNRKQAGFSCRHIFILVFLTCHFCAILTIQACDNFRCPLVFFVMRASQNSNNLYNGIMGNVNFKYIWWIFPKFRYILTIQEYFIPIIESNILLWRSLK